MNIEASPALPRHHAAVSPKLGMEARTLFRDQAPGEAAPTRPSASQAMGNEAAAKVELSKKSCLPCKSKDLQAMSEDSVAGWELKYEGDILKLHRGWKVKNFAKRLEFFQLVAAVAEEGYLSGHFANPYVVATHSDGCQGAYDYWV